MADAPEWELWPNDFSIVVWADVATGRRRCAEYTADGWCNWYQGPLACPLWATNGCPHFDRCGRPRRDA